METPLNNRATKLIRKMLFKIHAQTDRIFSSLMVTQWVFAVGCAVYFSPYSWNGSVKSIHPHVWFALVIGGILSFISFTLVRFEPGKPITRHSIAICQMLMSSLLIHVTGGRIETHFHIFGSFALLAFYRDWKVLVTGVVVVTIDHVLRGEFWPQSAFGLIEVGRWRWVEHAAWVLFENAFLIASCQRGLHEIREICQRQVELEDMNETIEQAVQDRTYELNVTQQKLLESQKLEAIGQLASGVAHDFNNVLSGILAYASILKEDYATDPVLVNGLQTIESSAERGADMTKKLLAFARKGNYEFTGVDLNKTVTETVSLLEPTLKGKVAVQVDVASDLWPTEGDSTQIFQVVMNLAVNAKDAMPSGGLLKISACNLDADLDYIKAHSSVPLGEYVRLSVEDNGSGMSTELQQKIFEPFFTTKAPGAGTGLGLSMVYGIMKNHKGAVSLYSQEGHGTVFHLYFPRSQLETATVVERAAEPAIERDALQEHRILLVDDEESMRKVGHDILVRYGGNVSVCEDGADAVDYVREKPHFDIVILDVIMPKMNGIDAFHELRKILPDARYILSSGYAESAEITRLRNDFNVQFIQKPYKGEALAREVMAAKKRVS